MPMIVAFFLVGSNVGRTPSSTDPRFSLECRIRRMVWVSSFFF